MTVVLPEIVTVALPSVSSAFPLTVMDDPETVAVG